MVQPSSSRVLTENQQRVVLLETTDTVPPAGTAAGALLFRKGPTTTVWDFKAGALPAGWSKKGTPTETFSGSGMLATMSAGQGYVGPTLALPSADYRIDFYYSTYGTSSSMLGPAFVDSASNGVSAGWYTSPSGLLTLVLSGGSYGSSFTNGGGTLTTPQAIRIIKTGTTYTTQISNNDGASWSSATGALAVATAIDRVGFFNAINSSTVTVTKVVLGPIPSSTTGRAIGWWDGSAIQDLA